jgi:hypothetical protein
MRSHSGALSQGKIKLEQKQYKHIAYGNFDSWRDLHVAEWRFGGGSLTVVEICPSLNVP